MLTPPEVYPLVVAWLQALDGPAHRTALHALAQLLTALLVGQSLRSAGLMRALLSLEGGSARQGYRRVARAWTRPWLAPAWLTPRLVRVAVLLVAPDRPGPTAGQRHLALDSVRCGRWEVFVLGVVWYGRVLPVSWAVLPYPWPKRRFTPPVSALVRAVAAAWPAETPPPHLLGDRAFPSKRLFQTLGAVGWGYTVRLRAKSWVTVGGQAQWVRALLATAQLGRWTTAAATYGSGPGAIAGTLIIGRGLPVLPWHQANAGSARHRAAQQRKRQQHLRTKHRRAHPDASVETDAWVVLFTTHATWRAATASYRRRWAIEGSYRDAQSGWDGQHGWDLEPVLARLPTAAQVERVVGLWALGALVQTWVGVQVQAPSAPAGVRGVVRQWTTTGRLSVWAAGQLALTEPSGRLHVWLPTTLQAGAARIAPPAAPARRRVRPRPPTQQAA
ncbi:MAG TPA: hypothetical protein VII06_10430 [Chloroflexota bacterium]|jgi:hypothetical protein